MFKDTYGFGWRVCVAFVVEIMRERDVLIVGQWYIESNPLPQLRFFLFTVPLVKSS